MTPTSHLYLDYYQADPAGEPLAIGGHVPLEKVYALDPVPAELTSAEARHILGAQGEEVAAPELQLAVPVAAETAVFDDVGCQSLLHKEGLHGGFHQFDAQHPMALPGQPGHVQALAAQRHQHPGSRLGGPVPQQPGIHFGQVKADLVTVPARPPEVFMHGVSPPGAC